MIKDILKEPLTWCLGVFFLFIIVIPGIGIYYSGEIQ